MADENKIELPIFSNYIEEKTDIGYETIQDFFLSWTIRCSADRFKNADARINEYARRLVYFLIDGENIKDGFYPKSKIPENFRILKVETKRQKGSIDLIALIEMMDSSSQSKLIGLNIENKFYHNLSLHQLIDYKKYVEDNYPQYQFVHLFITVDTYRANYEQEKKWCKESNYKYLTIGDLTSNIGMEETGNHLFDAYWFDK